MEGYIFNIQRFSLHDGPGIRTTVFLKGCPLRCAWCHNPESFKLEPQLSYVKSKCVCCGCCQRVCPNGVHTVNAHRHHVAFDKCDACGLCASVCDVSALSVVGYKTDARSVIGTVVKDKAYYDESGGGVTFSGGEATMQFLFLKALLAFSKQAGLHTCLDTAGYLAPDRLLELLPLVDLWLYDYKATDAADHKKFTGVDNALILHNLSLLAQYEKAVVLRCPIIPGVNDTPAHHDAIQALRTYGNITQVELLPYHHIGEIKWAQLGIARRS